MADRQRIIETNKSLRLIKNELESLLEKGVITDVAFDSIHAQLPAESSLGGSRSNVTSPAPAPAPAPTAAFNRLGLDDTRHAQAQATPPPPSYASTGPPSLPARNNPAAPAAPPSRPVLSRARALYRYRASDARDVSFEKDDRLAVLEHMNADWWMGRNERTGQEGIFPKSYVQPDVADAKKETVLWPPPPAHAPVPVPVPAAQTYGGAGGYPPPPPPGQNPYDAHVPPMAVAEQGSSAAAGGGPGAGGAGGAGGKAGEYGKKFGKKLGNAAVFGAGATLGGNLVNSIF